MTHRLLTTALCFLSALTCFASDTSQTTGILQGHLKVISLTTAQPADGNVPTVTPQTYIDYPLVVMSSDGKQQVAVITADSKGNYRVALPPGEYVLDIENRVRKHVRAKPVPFTVVSNQTVNVDFEMDAGIR